MPDPDGDFQSPERLMQRIEELEAAQSELTTKNLQLVQFVNILANDLRSPLRHILGFCRIVQHEYAPNLGPRGKSFLDNVVVSAKRIRELTVEERIPAGKAAVRPRRNLQRCQYRIVSFHP